MLDTRERDEAFIAVPPGQRPAEITLPAGAGQPPRRLTRELAQALGPLARWAADPGVTDILCNGHEALFVDRGEGTVRIPGHIAPSERAMRALAVRIIAAGGRHLDDASPCVDVRLGDGMRAHAALPPIAVGGTLLSLRLPRTRTPDMSELRSADTFPPGTEHALRTAIGSRNNILVTGAAGSGKTTLLSALLELVPPQERIVAIEDVAELRPRHPHFIRLEARQASIEGRGEVTLTQLVRETLRMRPDRLVVGECRGAEVRELLTALNTGHDGGACTLHASSLHEVPARIEALGALAGLDAVATARQAIAAIGLVVHLERTGGHRRVTGLGHLSLDKRDRLRITAEQAA